jgi:hypothetical protein
VTPSRDGAILEEGGGAPRFRSRGSRDRGRAAEARRCGRGQRGEGDRAPGAKGKRIGVRWLVAVGEHFIVKCTSIRTYI